MRINKPIGILLLLWPTLIALWLAASGKPNLKITIIFILGVIIMRSAGCIINDIIDRNLDGKVSRTKLRPLVTNKIKLQEAVILFLLLLSLAGYLVLQLNLLSIWIAIIGVILTIFYPLAKRITYYPQLILSITFSLGVPMAYAAILNNLPLEAICLFIIMACWIIVFDTQYAMVDKLDDTKAKIKSTAIIFGKFDKIIIAILQLAILLGLGLLGYIKEFNIYYFLGLCIGFSSFLYQQWLIKDRIPAKCFQAFLHNNYFGMAIFIGIFLTQTL